jgi:acyl-CoA synthetase (NDP forming)
MGVSSKGTNPGRIILENLIRSEGPVRDDLAVIHPRESQIAGVPCYPTCADLPAKVDLAVVAIPAEGALAAVTELVDTDRAESIILIPGGFAETGETHLATAIEAQLARGHATAGGGPVMVGGNCLGIVSRDHYNTFFIPLYKLPFSEGLGGNLAIVSQSGAYLVTFASNYDGIIQPRASISYGNQMDLTVADFIQHFLDDDRVDVIACYIEGFRPGDGARCLQAIGEARRRGKRVVVFKAGKTPLGAKAAASHTASLAGDYAVARACLEAAGADVAASLDEFEDLLKTFTLLSGRPAAGQRVGILSNAGFECSTVTDALAGLELAPFDAGTRAALDAALPSIAHRDNPVDATPMAGTEAYAAASAAILDGPDVDVAILSAVPVTGALDTLARAADGSHREDIEQPASLGRRWLEILATRRKPAVVVIDSGALYDPLCRQIEAAGVPVFRKIDRAARAVAAFCRGPGPRS